jgi:hypothetical protein
MSITYVNERGAEITGTTVLLSDGTLALVSLRPRHFGQRTYRANARIYGATDVLIPAVNAAEPRFVPYTDAKSSPEDVAAEKEWLSWRRKAVTATTKRLNALLPALSPIIGEVGKAKFSYNAGCSTCKCSPGYVTDVLVTDPATGRFADVYITSLAGLTRKAA